jgi:hypothetical protein
MAQGLQRQKETGLRFGEAMISLNLISQEKLDEFLKIQEAVVRFDVSRVTLNLPLVQQLGVEFCRGKRILPLGKETFQDRTLLTLVMADPTDNETIDRVQQAAACHVVLGRAPENEILAVLDAQVPN